MASLSTESLRNRHQLEQARLASEKAELFQSLPGEESQAWLIKDLWSLREELALSFEFKPMPGQVEWTSRNRACDALASQLAPFDDLVTRGKAASVLTNPIYPQAFVKWMVGKGIELPEAIRSMVAQTQEADWRQKYDNECIAHHRTRAEAQKLKD